MESLVDLPFKRLKRARMGNIIRTSYQLTNLKDLRYSFRVLAVNSALNTSAFSEEGQFEVFTPIEPQELTARLTSETSVELLWSDISNNEDGYEIERSIDRDWANVEVIQLPANAESYEDLDLMPQTTYSYRLRGTRDAFKSPYSKIVEARTSGTVTSIDQNDLSQEIKVFPNPALEGKFQVTTSNPVSSVQIIDSQGKPVDQKEPISGNSMTGTIEFDLSNQADGIYLVLIKLTDGRHAIKKVRIERAN